MIKNIVFDMGGVLLEFDPEKTTNKYYPEEYREVVLNSIFGGELWAMLDRGTLTVEDALPMFLAKLPESLHEMATPMLLDYYPLMPPYEESYNIAAEMKRRGFGIYLLSNATPKYYDYKDKIPVMSLMDGIFISSDYKLLKPEKEIYLKFLEVFSLKAEECFFIDDLERNINGAKAVGFDGFVFKGQPFEELKRVLYSLPLPN